MIVVAPGAVIVVARSAAAGLGWVTLQGALAAHALVRVGVCGSLPIQSVQKTIRPGSRAYLSGSSGKRIDQPRRPKVGDVNER